MQRAIQNNITTCEDYKLEGPRSSTDTGYHLHTWWSRVIGALSINVSTIFNDGVSISRIEKLGKTIN